MPAPPRACLDDRCCLAPGHRGACERAIVGSSLELLDALAMLDAWAPAPEPILILGETGTGKEAAARRAHARSGRRGPFIVAAAPDLNSSIGEATLLGYEPRAFTGGDPKGAPGLFERAHSGTLFLDEVGELSPERQALLLRPIQERAVTRLGPRAEPRAVDVRIVAATKRALRDDVVAGLWRDDLWHRLSGYAIEMPPLRARRGDIPALVEQLLAEHPHAVRPSVRALLESAATASHDWPGNVRELENVIRRLAWLARSRPLDRSDLARVGLGGAVGGGGRRGRSEGVTPSGATEDPSASRSNDWRAVGGGGRRPLRPLPGDDVVVALARLREIRSADVAVALSVSARQARARLARLSRHGGPLERVGGAGGAGGGDSTRYRLARGAR